MKKEFFQKLRLLIGLIFLCANRPAAAQIDMAAIARLHFQAESDSLRWFEGFAQGLQGQAADYPSHRSNGLRAPALVVRTTGASSVMEWKTAPIPANWSGDSATFVWACGFGSNLGQARISLTVNGQYRFEFSTWTEPDWHVAGRQSGTLSFTAVYQNHNGALFGYMYVKVPSIWLRQEKALTIKITALADPNENWYRTFTYRETLAYLRTRERREFFSDISFWNLGDATLKLVTRSQYAGQTVSARSRGQLLGETTLQTADALAQAELVIPREQQAALGDMLEVWALGKRVDTIRVNQITEQRVKAFLQEELAFEKYVFPPGEFPQAQWRRPGMVDNELGKFVLRTSFFNRHMQPVDRARELGRYGAVVEGTTPAGVLIKRYVTLYCAPVNLDDYGDEVSIRLNPLSALGISRERWQQYEENFRRFSFGNLITYLQTSPDAAIFLAGLSEMDSLRNGIDSPRLRDRQWWVTFKRQSPSAGEKFKSLALPVILKTLPAPELVEAQPPAPAFSPQDLARVRQICTAWAEAGGEPLVTLIAHRGHIVFHEAFGKQRDGRPITVNTPTWMASITKLLTGVLMMQFVDQGFVDLDAPIQKYLPELKTTTGATLTLRHLFTHTNGLGWHGEWGSDWNPALENFIAQCLPYLKIGAAFQYNRLGYALAGKIMERLSGEAVPYLFDHNILRPLGVTNAFVDNTYGSLYCTARELASLGQMLLNRGSYGQYRFLSEATFAQMLPAKLDRINPHLDRQWGIGTAPLGGNGLSDQTFGHEAASGAIFRVDPVHELIIVVGRDHPGPDYETFAARLVAACAAPLSIKK